MNTKNVLITIIVSILVMAGVSMLLFRMGGTTTQEMVYDNVAGDGRLSYGDGEIVLTEFSDFECPACRSVQPGVKQILSKYEGKVKFVYRHLPLTTIHPNAQLAAQASEAANIQGKFIEYHDLLFENQNEWSGESDPSELFVSYASELELDTVKFATDMESSQVVDLVNQDSLDASRMGLSSTPTFFVNNEKVEANLIEAKIESLLSSSE